VGIRRAEFAMAKRHRLSSEIDDNLNFATYFYTNLRAFACGTICQIQNTDHASRTALTTDSGYLVP
jgi:hypothetical protein